MQRSRPAKQPRVILPQVPAGFTLQMVPIAADAHAESATTKRRPVPKRRTSGKSRASSDTNAPQPSMGDAMKLVSRLISQVERLEKEVSDLKLEVSRAAATSPPTEPLPAPTSAPAMTFNIHIPSGAAVPPQNAQPQLRQEDDILWPPPPPRPIFQQERPRRGERMRRERQLDDAVHSTILHQLAQDLPMGRVLIRMGGADSSGPEPATEAMLDSLPDVEAPEGACVVCRDDFEEGGRCVRLPCGHHFHRACVAPWLRRHATCPTCRAAVGDAASTPSSTAAEPDASSPTSAAAVPSPANNIISQMLARLSPQGTGPRVGSDMGDSVPLLAHIFQFQSPPPPDSES